MRKFQKLIPFVLIALFFVSCADTANREIASKEPFDEIYGMSSNDKRVREVYKDIIDSYNEMSISDKQAFYEKSTKDFQGDNAIHPLPIVLAESEYDFLK